MMPRLPRRLAPNFHRATRPRAVLLLLVVLAVSPPSWAGAVRIAPLTPLDHQFMTTAVSELNDLLQRRLGSSLSSDRAPNRERDLQLLQTLLDRQWVAGSDVRLLQAMGVVMGQHLQREQQLRWVIYIDQLGRSRALSVADKEEYLFPVTQVSSRAGVGAEVNLVRIYQTLEQAVARARSKVLFK